MYIYPRNVLFLADRFSQDAFHDNWVLQWHPESLRDNKVAVSRPRVYLIDFETAIELDPALGPQTCVGFPYEETSAIGGYARPSCAEMKSGNSYDPFKVDVWQLMHHFPYTEFKAFRSPYLALSCANIFS